jgi:hypothetical protein
VNSQVDYTLASNAQDGIADDLGFDGAEWSISVVGSSARLISTASFIPVESKVPVHVFMI